MKIKKLFVFIAALVMALPLYACSTGTTTLVGIITVPQVSSALSSQTVSTPEPSPTPVGQIYLYGEQHAVKKIYNKELEEWNRYYQDENMRHLFVEYPYYTAEFINEWMKSDNDDILNEVYEDWKGTMSYSPDAKEFLKQIKLKCPETIFHGTDVGHQYNSTGMRFLQYLRDSKQENSTQYKLAEEAIEQGKYYYDNDDGAYRENKMAENFIREFDLLDGESIMGIYGNAHTGLNAIDATQSVDCMAKQLKSRYGDAVHSEDLTMLLKMTEPQKIDVIEINGKEYQASYFGKEDLTGFKDYSSREFWRLENAYDALKNKPKTGDNLPYYNYPTQIETGQVFLVVYTKTDKSVTKAYYRSDGNMWQGQPTTENFEIE